MENKKCKEIRICDMCDNPIKGKFYPVVDENFNKQRGVVHCGCMFDIPDEPKIIVDYNVFYGK